MSKARDEELQVNWACSAQNPDLLPDSWKINAKPKTNIVKHLKGIFDEKS